MRATDLQERLRALGSAADAAFLQRFFKTGPGQYGEGDRFIGVRVPVIRRVAREFAGMPLEEVARLLRSPIHEERLAAVVLCVTKMQRCDEAQQRPIYDLYLSNTAFINNWDLVDVSAPQVVGAYLQDRKRSPLTRLARSRSLWERRISIVATHWFIRSGEVRDTMAIASMLLADEHDLIHKATGWMLREAGKRNQAALEDFLRQHCRAMPRTMLRYAIERFDAAMRKRYLAGEV